MADNQHNINNESTPNSNRSGMDTSKGRLHGSDNPNIESDAPTGDISQVDQQEGNMNNGTLGGNFGEAINTIKENKDQ